MRYKLGEIIEFNPKESISKGILARKIAMENLQPFQRKIDGFTFENFKSGTKFRNNDTLMARITPCLENGKTAYVNILEENEVAFGSTEYFVLRAKANILDSKYLYYLSISNEVRETVIKSMTGTSGRQRAQKESILEFEIDLPSLDKQKKIASILDSFDTKIELNKQINDNLLELAQSHFEHLIIDGSLNEAKSLLSDIALINPLRKLSKGQEATYVEMKNLPTTSSFPLGWEKKIFAGGMKFTNGDTILARITPCLENGKAAYIDFLEKEEIAFGSTEYIVLSSKFNDCNEMLYFLARYSDFVNYAVGNMNGSSGRQRVAGEIIGKYELNIPSFQIIEEFNKIAKPVMAQVRENSFEIRNLIFLRDSLLPKLLSGEILI